MLCLENQKKQNPVVKLTINEIAVLNLTILGYNIKEISKKIFYNLLPFHL